MLAVALITIGLYSSRRSAPPAPLGLPRAGVEVPKERWTMPPAALLSRPQWSAVKRVAMWGLGSYMVVALALLIVKSVQLAGG